MNLAHHHDRGITVAAQWFNHLTTVRPWHEPGNSAGMLTSLPPSFASTVRRAAASATALALALVSGHALADEATPAETPPPDASSANPTDGHDDLLFTAGAGIFADAKKAGGTVSFTGLRQKGLLGYGGTFEYSGAVFDYTSVTAAPMVGVFIDGPRSLRAGLAAAGGIHSYTAVGRGFISSSDPGANGITAFVGARLFLGGEVGGKVRFHYGLQLSADDDLARSRTPYLYSETGGFGGGAPRSETATHTVGALRLGGMVALGTAFDL